MMIIYMLNKRKAYKIVNKIIGGFANQSGLVLQTK